MEPWPPAQPPQHWERQAARGAWAEVLHGLPPQPRQQLIRTGHPPRPGSWDGSQLSSHQPWEEGHRPRRDIHKHSRTSYHESSYPSRQGYEDPHWQYPAASYSNDYTYQWQPVAWQDDRDPRQGEHYGKSASYHGRHYYRGYHPNLASKPPGQDRTQISDSHKERHISSGQSEWAGGETLSQDSGEASGQPQGSSGQPSLLLQYHESGLSSSSYELSQYIRDGSDHYDPMLPGTWSPAQAGGPLVSTPTPVVPHKFSWPHVAVCFGAGGQLVLACPHQPVEGQPAYVELHNLEAILHDTKELQELQAFPGPLARLLSMARSDPECIFSVSLGMNDGTLNQPGSLSYWLHQHGHWEDLHKVDVMTFCQQKIAMSCDLSTQKGRDSALLWKLLLLLCRQNGSMVGSDTAELLMQDCRREEKYKRQNPAANLIGLTDDELMSRQPGTLDLITGEVPPVVETQEQIVEKFTKLLYYGRKKDALVWAMRNHLWGHALFLSSKMDPRTYSWVLTGFTSTLATNDPLQTLFQLMSGRIPQAALCCGDATWGDWRPHLAVMLSNKVGDVELNNRAIVTMGDTLAGKGAVEAAHFCYLMADIPFGYFGSKADRMALLGSSHRQTFARFARTEAIQRMEIFEYCQRLQQPKSFLLPFQVYKLLYASRLADHGLPGQALQYCEQIATVLLGQDPANHPVLAQQVMKLSERLKLSDPLLLEMPEQDQTLEPDWLLQLRACCREWEVEDDLSQEAAPAQLELSWTATSTADEEPGQELPQTEDYQYDQWYEPTPLQGPSSHQDVSLRPPALTQVTASPLLGAEQELQPPTPGPGTATPPGGIFVEPRRQVVPPAGEVAEPWGVPASSGGVQPPLPVEQEELKARARTLSESSTISLDSQPSSESAAEDTAEESAAEEKPDEDKSSGFRWFGWFRSKPTKETSPKAASETALDSSTSGQQEWMPPAPPDAPPTAETSYLAPLPPRNLGGTEGENTFAVNPVPTETSFHRPPPPVGTIPLFNPVQISQLAAIARPTQPKRLSQRRYPNAL